MMWMLRFILDGFFYASILFLISSGLTLIFSVAGIINLAHGCLYMLGAYIAATLIKSLIDTPYAILAFPVAAFIVGLLGLFIERFIIRWIYGRDLVYQLLLTFGLALILSDITRIVFGTEPIYVTKLYINTGVIDILGSFYPVYNFIVIIVSLIIGCLIWIILYKTRIGMMIRACALDREMSEAIGLNTGNVFSLTFLMGAILAGISGALVVPQSAAMLGIDADALVESFIVIVIGGVGSIKGAFIGSLLIGLIRSFGIVFFPEIELAIAYLVMIVVLLVRPRGLFGREFRVA
ncbi:MAG TPA: branched-chain amino acid ABC transporter permease [Desulfurococcales archaeon]|nr:branched-chain amino acid ABC transporter permease [Desulfurococcales archaeon]